MLIIYRTKANLGLGFVAPGITLQPKSNISASMDGFCHYEPLEIRENGREEFCSMHALHPVMKRIGRRPQNVISCVSKLMNIASLSIKIGVLDLNSLMGAMIDLCLSMTYSDFYSVHSDYQTRPFPLPAILVGDGRLGGISGTISAYESLKLRGYDVVAIVFEDHGLVNEVPLSCYLQNGSLKEIMMSAFHGRMQKLHDMRKRARDIFWWPFTQHEIVLIENRTVIDSSMAKSLQFTSSHSGFVMLFSAISNIYFFVLQETPFSYTQSPYFVRATPDGLYQAKGLASICQGFEWHEVVIIYEDTEYGNTFIAKLRKEFQEVDIQLLTFKLDFEFIPYENATRHRNGSFAFPERNIVGNNWSRFLVVVWLFVAYILMQSYTAKLSLIFTVDKLQFAFLEDYCVGYQQGCFVREFLINEIHFNELKLKKYSKVDDFHDAMSRGRKNGGIDVISSKIPCMNLLKRYGSKYTKAFPLGSPLVSYFTRAILNVTQGAIMKVIEQKNFGPEYPYDQDSINQESSATIFAVFFSMTSAGKRLTAMTTSHGHRYSSFTTFRNKGSRVHLMSHNKATGGGSSNEEVVQSEDNNRNMSTGSGEIQREDNSMNVLARQGEIHESNERNMNIISVGCSVVEVSESVNLDASAAAAGQKVYMSRLQILLVIYELNVLTYECKKSTILSEE
ncbi:hypothetical protein ACH5RR_003789 [Cinchona calisaya]|uniref:Ionotropic glutamate receptor n=1 Tax=Cinchona calisaya TaxID=153742 RepID=A0ABD3AVS3_9GENT